MREKCCPPQSFIFNLIYAIGFAISFGIIRFSKYKYRQITIYKNKN